MAKIVAGKEHLPGISMALKRPAPGQKIKFKGKIKAELVDVETGKVVDTLEIENTITNAGDKIVADAMSDRGETLPSHIAVGTTSGGKTAASNTLENEIARVALDSTVQGTGADDNDVIYTGTFPAGTGTGALVEMGLFNDPSAGDMFAYQEFSVVNKGATMAWTITWTMTFGSS